MLVHKLIQHTLYSHFDTYTALKNGIYYVYKKQKSEDMRHGQLIVLSLLVQ
jgi:hypothetical protein